MKSPQGIIVKKNRFHTDLFWNITSKLAIFMGSRVHYTNTLIKILFLFILLCIPVSTVYGAGLNITYDGKATVYDSKTVMAKVNGKAVNLSKTPGIVISSTSMVPYDLVFKNGLNVSCTYSSKKGTITMKKNNHTLIMTINSNIGTLDGKKVTVPVAPKKVTYAAAKTTKILVPSEFTAVSLGFGFSWSNDSSNIITSFTKPFTYYNNGKMEYYSGIQGKVIVEEMPADNNEMPLMFLNGTAVADAKKVFMNSSIKAGFKYNAKTKQLTLTKDSQKIIFTMGSMTAKVNGENQKLTVPARELRKTSKGSPYIVVPLEFSADKLGYQYSFQAGTKEVSITKKAPVKENQSYFNWTAFPEMAVPINNVTTAVDDYSIEGIAGSQGTIQAVLKDNMIQDGNEHYIITSTMPFGSVKAEHDVETLGIRIDCSNTYTEDMSYPFQGEETVSEIYTAYGLELQNTIIYIETKISNAKYKVELSPDKCSIYLTVYPNYITEVTGEYENSKDIITLTGVAGLKPTVSTDTDNIYFDFKGTISAVDSQPFETEEAYCIRSASIEPLDGNTTRLTIAREGTSSYTVKNIDNQYIITFQYNNIKIAVDCGHGANTVGKRTPPLPNDLDFNGDGIIDAKKGTSINEHTGDVGIGKYLVKELERCGFSVYQSALGEEDIPLEVRRDNIAAENCDYSVSIHFNAYGDGKTFNDKEGVEVYSYKDKDQIGDSEALAKAVLAEVIKGTEQLNRGYKQSNLAMCKTKSLGTKASILVECAFMTNLNEVENMMANEEFWKETAKEIAMGFCNYLKVPYVPET